MNLPTRASFFASGVIAIVIATACGGSTDSSTGAGGSSGTGSSGGSSGASSSGTAGGSSSGTTSGSSSGGAADAGPVDQCNAPTDCAWGEIKIEILAASDCMCLFGCPYIPLSKTTVERRKSQYSALCTPNKDGAGKACPVDDCAPLKDITCVDHKCVAGSPDGGDGG